MTCNYVGANADTVEKAVTIPLEEAINGVEGMRYMSVVQHQQRDEHDHRDIPDRL